MKILIRFLPLLALTFNLNAKEIKKDTLLAPFKINERLLSGLDIPKQVLKAHPEREYFQKRIYKGTELSVYILSSETAVNEISNFPIDEFVYFLNGRADISSKDGNAFSFFAGDYIFVPKGFSGKWTNNGGNKYHLELSVISNNRVENTSAMKAKIPFVLDRELISGIGLTTDVSRKYRDVIYSGAELEVVTESEEPCREEILDNQKEQFIHILNGIVTITPSEGHPQTFYKGDFFVLPKGFTGNWKSEGQNLFRTLKVVQK